MMISFVSAALVTFGAAQSDWPAKMPATGHLGKIGSTLISRSNVAENVTFAAGVNQFHVRADTLVVNSVEVVGSTVSDTSRYRMVEFSWQDGTFGSPFLAPVRVDPDLGKDGYVGLQVPPQLMQASQHAGIAVLILDDRPPSPRWYMMARTPDGALSKPLQLGKFGFSPGANPSQTLKNGSKTFVARAEVKESVSGLQSLFAPAYSPVWSDLTLDATGSTQSMDPNATGSLDLQLGGRFGQYRLSHATIHVGVQSDEAALNQMGYATLESDWILGAKTFYRPSNLALINTPVGFSLGLRGEERWKQDTATAPYHTAPSVGYVFAEMKLGPAWLFPRNPKLGKYESDFSVFADLKGYYFPNDESASGFSSRRFESSASLELDAPWKLWLWVPALTLTTGAVQGETFTRSVSWGLQLRMRF